MISLENLPQAKLAEVDEIHRQTDIPGVTETLRICKRCDRSYKALAYNRIVVTSGFCIPCGDIEFPNKKAIEAEECRQKKFLEICPPLYQDCNPHILPNPEKFWDVMKWQRGRKGMVIIGPSQKGKTRSAWSKLRDLYVNHGVSFKAISDIEFSHRVANFGRSTSLGEWIESLIRTPILFIDDLGKSVPTERTVKELQHLVEARVQYFRPMIITMQITGKEWAQSLSTKADSHTAEALINRIKAHCDVVNF